MSTSDPNEEFELLVTISGPDEQLQLINSTNDASDQGMSDADAQPPAATDMANLSAQPQTASSADDPSNQLQITNSTMADFAVVDVVSQSPQASASQMLVRVLKLLKTTNGAASIVKGTSASVLLSDTYVDPTTGKTEPSILYSLIFSTTDWLAPLNVRGVLQNLLSKTYKPVTVAESDRQAMLAAFKFVTMIAAYPTSTLAKGFNAAVNAGTTNAGQAQSGDDVTKGVDAFFKGTKEYTNVTLAAVVAVNSYYDTFPFVWARYQNTMTYYLYSSDGKNPTRYEGQLSMTRPASMSIPDVTDSNGGYTIVYTDSNNTNTTLSYVKSQFLDSTTVDIPSICLQGLFTLKSRLTGKSADNQIMSILTGSINGITVLGVDTKQDTNNQPDYWQTLFHPQGAQQVINSILTIGGLLMMAHFALSGLKTLSDWVGLTGWVRQKLGLPKPENLPDMIRQQTQELQNALRQNSNEMFGRQTAGRQQLPLEEEAESAEEIELGNMNAWAESAALDNGVQVEAQRLETLVEALPDGPTAPLEQAATNLQGIEENLSSASPTNITEVVQGQAEQLSNVRQSITVEQTSLEQQLSTEIQQNLAEQKVQSDAVAEDLTRIGEDGENIREGSLPEEEPAFEEIPLDL